jgi:hypothetical protein
LFQICKNLKRQAIENYSIKKQKLHEKGNEIEAITSSVRKKYFQSSRNNKIIC